MSDDLVERLRARGEMARIAARLRVEADDPIFAAAAAEIARLQTERDEALQRIAELHQCVADMRQILREEGEERDARIARLQAALRPFAEASNQTRRPFREAKLTITTREWSAAAAALADAPE